MSRQQVIDAATTIVRAEGYEQLTVRRIAAELGVAPMTLYRHVRDKDDLLDEVVDRLLIRAWRPRADSADWRAWTTEAADKLRRFLVAQPAALHVYLRHPVVSPTAVVRMDAIIGVLEPVVGDQATARRAFAAVQTYTIGFAALEASRAGWRPPPHEEAHSAGELAAQMARYTSPRQFADGLSYLLDGIAAGAN
jgi:AcrR family transcriptional regulator